MTLVHRGHQLPANIEEAPAVLCGQCGADRDVRPYDAELLCATCRAIQEAFDNGK